MKTFAEELETNLVRTILRLEETATKGDVYQYLTSHGFEYSPVHGDEGYHHPSGHSLFIGKNGESWWHEHNNKDIAHGGSVPGYKVYDNVLAHAKKMKI